uniref:CHK kinase-like domain-containing protein n=1 Tax=Clastoptera arizonana TaxID=38151 RepID=A0A1B6D550_9HEMI
MNEIIDTHDITNLIKNIFGNRGEIIECKITNFNSMGINFSSILYGINLNIQSVNKKENHQIQIIAKLLPGKETQMKVNSKLGFLKEIKFYETVIPFYKEIQIGSGLAEDEIVDIFPTYYGSVYSADDNNDIILLSDLKEEHYKLKNLRTGLDYNHTCLVLQEIAKFHATGIALKKRDDKIFKTSLKLAAEPSLQNTTNPERKLINLKFRGTIKHILSKMPECKEYIKKVDQILESTDKQPIPNVREPFATLLHNDLWYNNILFKYQNGKPFKVKFVDFQTTVYNSPVRDIIHFIFTSTEESVQQQFDHLVQVYYKSLSEYLVKLKCDLNEFNYTKFEEEILLFGTTKMKHTILLYKDVCGSDFKSDKFDHSRFETSLRNLFYNFSKRNWI